MVCFLPSSPRLVPCLRFSFSCVVLFTGLHYWRFLDARSHELCFAVLLLCFIFPILPLSSVHAVTRFGHDSPTLRNFIYYTQFSGEIIIYLVLIFSMTVSDDGRLR